MLSSSWAPPNVPLTLALPATTPCDLMYSSWPPTNAPLCSPSGRRAPPNAPMVLTSAALRALSPSEHRPTHPLFLWATPYATLCSPRDCRPLNPWSFRAPPHSPLVLPGTASCALGPSRHRPTPRDAVAARPRQRSSQKMPLWPQKKDSSREIWIEEEKQKSRLTVSTLLNRVPASLC